MESLNLKKCCDQLLEMVKRNKLLYFSYGRSYLETKFPDSSSLFASLLSGKKLTFYDFDKLLRNSNVTNDESFDEKKD